MVSNIVACRLKRSSIITIYWDGIYIYKCLLDRSVNGASTSPYSRLLLSTRLLLSSLSPRHSKTQRLPDVCTFLKFSGIHSAEIAGETSLVRARAQQPPIPRFQLYRPPCSRGSRNRKTFTVLPDNRVTTPPSIPLPSSGAPQSFLQCLRAPSSLSLVSETDQVCLAYNSLDGARLNARPVTQVSEELPRMTIHYSVVAILGRSNNDTLDVAVYLRRKDTASRSSHAQLET